MAKGPRGEKRPADAIGRASFGARIATGEIEDSAAPKSAAAELGAKGGKARAQKLSPSQRTRIAKKAAASRWKQLPR